MRSRRPDLFSGRPWIFTPDGADGQDALVRLSRFAAGLGARTTSMTAEQHDRLMAYVSHLPQLAASALMEVVGAAATHGGPRLAGKGLLDTTRLASSPSDVWRDICATNADAIGEALDHLIERLTELRADLQRGRRSMSSSRKPRAGARTDPFLEIGGPVRVPRSTRYDRLARRYDSRWSFYINQSVHGRWRTSRWGRANACSTLVAGTGQLLAAAAAQVPTRR